MSHTHGYNDNKADVLRRLWRAEGQVRGVARMVEEDTYCIDVMTQITAAKSALDRVALELLRDHARHCLTDKNQTDASAQAKADELVDTVGRMLSR